MGDANPIRNLEDHSRPSHEGYRNAIEISKGAKAEDSEVAWETIEDLSQYEKEGCKDPIVLEEESTDYENPDLEQLLGVIECDVEKLKDEIRAEENRVKKIEKITSPPLVRESTFGFKHGTNNNQNIKSEYDVENSNPQSTLQVLPSFEENTPPVTYPNEVKEVIGITIEVEPLDETPLEDLGLNSCNHDIPLSSREIPNFDEPESQPQPLPSCPSLDMSIRRKRPKTTHQTT
uniref:Ribonuclease H-like domain-containing protein n=1 Tax=Tanacetum cinerariifolium TaxID=118510 RepID=A0A6L2N5T2_TANCI|nr:ribonuclease H-like domain-containing protein [Tanacetum cinerariifolium]